MHVNHRYFINYQRNVMRVQLDYCVYEESTTLVKESPRPISTRYVTSFVSLASLAWHGYRTWAITPRKQSLSRQAKLALTCYKSLLELTHIL